MKKILLLEEPIADAYVHMGMEFSMFMSDEKYYPWLINNFIQIYTLKDMQAIPDRTGTLDFLYNRYGDWQMFHFSANPYIDYEKMAYSTLKIVLNHMTIIELLENAINDDKYIFMPIDMYEIPYYGVYQEVHRIHHMFLAGYDDERKVFFAYDNFKGGKYRLEEIAYEDVIRGYHTLVSDETVASWSETGGICFYRFYQKPWHRDKDELYQVNIQTVFSGIREYLMIPEYCDSYSHISYYRYGIDCYTELINWLKFGINSEDCYVDHRAFSAMRDHKKVMLFRFKYLQERLVTDIQTYIDSYEFIKKEMDTVVMKILKGNTAKNTKQFSECIDKINAVKLREVKTLNGFLKLDL